MALSIIQLLPLRKLRTDAAASYKRMLAAGMPKKRLESAHRSRAAQQKLRNAYLAYKAGKGPLANFALDPDDSHHVDGTAIDSWDAQQNWLIKHGWYYGWTQDKNEDWHFDYDPAKDAALKALKAEQAKKAAAKAKADARAKVKKAQKAMGGLVVDGIPGAKTNAKFNALPNRSKALKAVQKILGVTADGIKGPKTKAAWAKLVQAAK